VRRHIGALVLWAVLGAFTGWEVGQTIRIYQNWPAPPAGYVWNHFASK
jgi:hypothetical protein